jgi:type IV pilus assembly protein PilV
MSKNIKRLVPQRGMMMIEALMAILVFSLGVLGMVGVNSLAASTQSDAQYRNEANRLANRIVNEMWLNVDRSNDGANLPGSLATFSHRADDPTLLAPAGNPCANKAGTPSANPLVTGWVTDATGGGAAGVLGGLPGATTTMQQIVVGADNQVTVTVCWKAPTDIAVRRHVVTSFIN